MLGASAPACGGEVGFFVRISDEHVGWTFERDYMEATVVIITVSIIVLLCV